MEEAEDALKKASGDLEQVLFHVKQAADSSAKVAIRTEKITRPISWIGGGFKKIGGGFKRIFGGKK